MDDRNLLQLLGQGEWERYPAAADWSKLVVFSAFCRTSHERLQTKKNRRSEV